MALYKKVNGSRVKLTAAEEAQITQEWAQTEARKASQADAALAKQAHKNQALSKLQDLGLTLEELKALGLT